MLSRREFFHRSIQYALFLAANSALASCGPQPTSSPNPPSVLPDPTDTPLPTPPRATSPVVPTVVAAMTATPIPPTAGEPYLVVVRGASPAAITRAAIDALGGIGKFIKPGYDVIVKPNICNSQNTFEYASTTNPEVLAEIVKLCLGAGAKRVRVMDQPFSGTAVEGYKRSGIRDAVELVGGQMEIMTSAKYIDVPFPAASRDLKSQKIYQDILKADALINVPIAKHHSSAQVTMAMKGLMGVILNRNDIHWALDQRIADLSAVIKPTLNVIDAVRVLTRNGPTGGRLDYVKLANTIIASHDPVAADAFTTRLFFNKQPQDIGYIRIGASMGLGRYDFENLRIQELTA